MKPVIDANGNIRYQPRDLEYQTVTESTEAGTTASETYYSSARLLRSGNFEQGNHGNQADTNHNYDSNLASCYRCLKGCLFCRPQNISSTFLILLGFFCFSCVAASQFEAVAFFLAVIISGWLISLSLHEFGHAVVAYKGGDNTVKDKGYLSLDLLEYADPTMTFIVPTALLLMGGVALPGGAVSIMCSHLRSPYWESLVSIAGPIANLVFGAFVALLMHVYSGLVNNGVVGVGGSLGQALALLAYFQIMAFVLNMIPLPPLDGWGILSPWLSSDCFVKRYLRNPWHAKSITLVTFLVIFVGVQWIPGILWLIRTLTSIYGVDTGQLSVGYEKMMKALSLF